ncbi:hypothetical protein WMW72_12180 [Paenibacillus filicis]|uniref:Phage neck terminator protein gp12-like domain-containing protein n=1 Tax=Paenibacillus filicis TaxID=669464 RepID=A0ABU9DIH5_9BACL
MALSIQELEDIFFDQTARIIGLDPNDERTQNRIRVTWPAKGAPAWKREEDVAFFIIDYDDDLYTRQMDVSYVGETDGIGRRTVGHTQVLRVSWICYGPNSFSDAATIRAGLFGPTSKEAFAGSNLALITDVPMPKRVPEQFGGQWWDRTSFWARFNERVLRQENVSYLESADVKIIPG